jgi:hypothetical protein
MLEVLGAILEGDLLRQQTGLLLRRLIVSLTSASEAGLAVSFAVPRPMYRFPQSPAGLALDSATLACSWTCDVPVVVPRRYPPTPLHFLVSV